MPRIQLWHTLSLAATRIAVSQVMRFFHPLMTLITFSLADSFWHQLFSYVSHRSI